MCQALPKRYASYEAILQEIPLGNYRVDIGLKLRQALLLNGVLFNSEAWHSVTSKDLDALSKADESLLRSILQCHSKTPREFLYLETGTIPIRFIVASRRLHYLHTIVNRSEDELTKRVYESQARNPQKGDFVLLVKDDFTLIGEEYDETTVLGTGKDQFSKFVETEIQRYATM